MQINPCVIQASLSGPLGSSTFNILIPSSHSQEYLQPSPLKCLNFLSCSATVCPKLVPEGPCGTFLLGPLTQHVPIGFSLLQRS